MIISLYANITFFMKTTIVQDTKKASENRDSI